MDQWSRSSTQTILHILYTQACRIERAHKEKGIRMHTHRHTIGSLVADWRVVIKTMCCGYSWYNTDQCQLCVCERERMSAVAAHSFHSNVETHLGLHGNLWLAPTEREKGMWGRKREEVKTQKWGKNDTKRKEEEETWWGVNREQDRRSDLFAHHMGRSLARVDRRSGCWFKSKVLGRTECVDHMPYVHFVVVVGIDYTNAVLTKVIADICETLWHQFSKVQ